ncbi:MAG: UDP-N-acetylmuramate--L-alanine ligase [Actinomycetota bacterium]|nr:UDP-N-acetylmuramate--L-alanine ligase [Actinomycetota bacterium]MDA8168000.1 UDP-N-acetylmuramate--L-alanine ligase [Actinomycetota bacterium]
MKASKKLHFIGIGGAGMSGIAQVSRSLGYEVSGSDLKRSRYTRMLNAIGIEVAFGHDPANLRQPGGQPDAVVVSSAISSQNVELNAALDLGIPVYHRAQMLAELMGMKRGIAIAGTHGKTTTTSMVAHTMELLGLEPSYVVGGELNDVGSNARAGSGDWLVAEADESDGSLLYLHPEIAVITNVELDHHSHYSSIEQVVEVFERFVAGLPADGALVIWDTPQLRRLAASTKARVITYGLNGDSDYRAENILVTRDGTSFLLSLPQGEGASGREQVVLSVRGSHNVLNAMAALAVLDQLGAAPATAAPALTRFSGAARRFEIKGEAGGVTIVDDYAHHPTEIQATLEAARAAGWSRIIGAFQPHLYSRTRYLHDEFGRALNLCDLAIVTDVFGAREEPEPGISGKLIVDSALKWEPEANIAYIPKARDIVPLLLDELRPGDLVLTLGAGDIFKVGEELLAALERQASLV